MTGQPGHSHGCLTPSSAETSAQGSASSPRLNRPYPPHPMRAPWKDTSDISLNSWQKWTHDLTMKMNRIPSLQFGTPGLFQRASCSRIQKEPLRRTQILAVIPYSENLELWRLLTNTDLKLTYVSFLGALSANSGHQEGLAHHIFPTLFFLSQPHWPPAAPSRPNPTSTETASTRSSLQPESFDGTNPPSVPACPFKIARLYFDPRPPRLYGAALPAGCITLGSTNIESEVLRVNKRGDQSRSFRKNPLDAKRCSPPVRVSQSPVSSRMRKTSPGNLSFASTQGKKKKKNKRCESCAGLRV
nr:uncharacterized protein LOC121831570 [Peromyscus maniculatus bairdii]